MEKNDKMGEYLQKTLKKWYNNNPLAQLAVSIVSGKAIIELMLFTLKVIITLSWSLNSLLPPLPPGPELVETISTEDIIRLLDDIVSVGMFSVYCIYQFLLFLRKLYIDFSKDRQTDATNN